MKYSIDIEQYIINHIDSEHPVLNELARQTNIKIVHPRMLSGHVQGNALQMFCKMINPLTILEIGTYTGYSAICMALATQQNAKIFTIEINDEIADFSNNYFIKAGVSDKIIAITGDALQIIPTLNVMFDLVFIDGAKNQYPQYYNLVFNKINPGGYIIADNVLWDEKVISSPASNDHDTKGIIEFNTIIKNDTRIEKTILPFRDGLMIIRKK